MAEHDFIQLDEQRLTAFHWRAMLITGLGVFCDGYDLSSVGIVLPQILRSFGHISLTTLESAALAASALLGASIGALVFGALAQKGRARLYGLDVLILGLAALSQAFAPNLNWLIGLRFVLGLGVGGDYVLSPTIMAEHSNRADRGRAVGLGLGTMWPLGALAAALITLILQGFGVPESLLWRIVLAAGAVPAISVLYFRRRMPETAQFLGRVAGDQDQAAQVIADISGEGPITPMKDERRFGLVFALHSHAILSAALLWMVYDLVVFASILFGPSLIANSLGLRPLTFTIASQVIFVIPASIFCCIFVVDRVGRKPLQIWGFLFVALLIGVFALLQSRLLAIPILAFIIHGLYNVAQTGPGLVSGAGLLGVELAPTRIRSVAQGVTVAGGRVGAAVSAFGFPLLFERIGPAGAYWIIACLALVGALLTQVLVPETGRISLEAITEAGL